MSWTGFSDEELKNLKSSQEKNSITDEKPHKVKNFKEVQFGKNRSKRRPFTFPQSEGTSKQGNASSSRLPKLSMLTPSEMVTVEKPPLTSPTLSKQMNVPSLNKNSKIAPLPSLPENGENSDTEDNIVPGTEECIDDSMEEKDMEKALNEELSKVEIFQSQQKQIEELNKQKKHMLVKAIEERKQKAKEESSKLKQIQQELSHLDNTLTNDVSIMRDKIDAVSIQFMEAQKKYEKAEKEFVACKLELIRTVELKEKMTEHLYLLIHQNELHKASKLSDLMAQLQLCESSSSPELQLCDLPPLSAFSTYTIQTFPAPTSPGSPIQLINCPMFSSVKSPPTSPSLSDINSPPTSLSSSVIIQDGNTDEISTTNNITRVDNEISVKNNNGSGINENST